ncbi:MAG: outer membrane protein assembly factor BamB family protein [Candidatus Hodarchaeales archaeon]
MSPKTYRTIFFSVIVFLSVFALTLPSNPLLMEQTPQKVEGGVLRLRRFATIPNLASGEQDILVIGGNAIARIEGTKGETLWRTNAGEESATNFLIGNSKTDGRIDILAVYGNPVSVERVNESDGETIESYSELLNYSSWNLEADLVDQDGLYPQEIIIGTTSSLILMKPDFSDAIWNISLERSRNSGVFPFSAVNGTPFVGTWLDEGMNSTFMMLNGIDGAFLWNLSLPKEGHWFLYRFSSSIPESNDFLLFFATQNHASIADNILLVHLDNGSILWKRKIASMWFKAIQGNFSGSGQLELLLVGENENEESLMVALNGTNGNPLWELSKTAVKLSVADFTNDSISDLAFVSERSIEVMDGTTREPLWEPRRFGATIQAICTAPTSYGEIPKVIVGLSDGKVHALNATSGETIWVNNELAENPIIELAKSPAGSLEAISALCMLSSFVLLRSRRKKEKSNHLTSLQENN